ncbi:carboxy-S-adenosyl-L-methionine synthase CmoA [Marinihelvus fidelis]|uniref:Carboxy-S-adenosyl-L-methionine synthase n=1 Tax=Marinihelvus fidelis TaxID=2613842 RepID=A0A5N0T965_9GAMM|nr:carboxy-S-adenosyl-L-methionine synthase CmoA [Marinihelvus fidelis]KAA9131500.1 carboxy-S-adenosyl-L-methionine synthase CmoA [Marinihelvus fidelis]
MSEKDTLFQRQPAGSGSFRFDERVVEVFPDMIDRSVPGYSLIVPMIGQLSRRFAQPGTVIHDLGASLGAVTFVMRQALAGRDVRIVATDTSAAMVERFRALLDQDAADDRAVPVDVVHGDIRETAFENVSMAVLNFTLQFVPVEERGGLLARIAAGMNPGGALVLSEKLRFEDDAEQARQTDWHHDYKRLNGYSELEIARKRAALERVLLPETRAEHEARLFDAGFSRVTRWFQCFGFCSFLAEK